MSLRLVLYLYTTRSGKQQISLCFLPYVHYIQLVVFLSFTEILLQFVVFIETIQKENFILIYWSNFVTDRSFSRLDFRHKYEEEKVFVYILEI